MRRHAMTPPPPSPPRHAVRPAGDGENAGRGHDRRGTANSPGILRPLSSGNDDAPPKGEQKAPRRRRPAERARRASNTTTPSDCCAAPTTRCRGGAQGLRLSASRRLPRGSAQYWLGETYYARKTMPTPPRPLPTATRNIQGLEGAGLPGDAGRVAGQARQEAGGVHGIRAARPRFPTAASNIKAREASERHRAAAPDRSSSAPEPRTRPPRRSTLRNSPR